MLLDSIQNQAIRIAINAFKTSPIIALQLGTALLLDITRQKINNKFMYKIATD